MGLTRTIGKLGTQYPGNELPEWANFVGIERYEDDKGETRLVAYEDLRDASDAVTKAATGMSALVSVVVFVRLR